MTKVTNKLLSAILVTVLLYHVTDAQLLSGLNPPPEDAVLDFTGLATRYGHQPKQYEVITEDGYILTLFRLIGRSKYPVLLTHDFLDTSDTWLLRGEDSLGITLANDGYDVWFGNTRGNRYSQGHVSLDANTDPSYWDWSFHEIGYYDLPAIIDTVLNETNASNLTAIGQSRGNQIFYILGSTRPEYNSKVNVMIALAPICYFQNTQPPVTTIFRTVPMLNRLFNIINIRVTQIFGYNSVSTRFLRAFCTFPLIGPSLCLNLIIFPIGGFDRDELEPSFVNVFIYHFPAGDSWRDLLHFAQIRNRNQFAQFDYGTTQNLLVYQSAVPPVYNLTRVTMPIALFPGRNDRLSTLPDVELLRQQLPNVVDYTVNRRALLNHADTVWGRRMNVYLFPDIYRILNEYNGV